MRTFYKEQLHKSGNFADVQIFPVYRKTKTRSKKSKPSSETQKKLNDRNAAMRLTRLLHRNFCKNDIVIHLTYRDEDMPTAEESKRLVQNYIRRIKRLYKKSGIELKYVWLTEQGKKSGRVHHHMVLPGGVDRTVLEETWGKGYANSKALQFTKDGLAGLSYYMTKQQYDYRHYNASRNLYQPEVLENEYRISGKTAGVIAEMSIDAKIKLKKLYPEYVVASVEANPTDTFGTYVSIRLVKIEAILQGEIEVSKEELREIKREYVQRC